jgi:hypothetical protein
MSQLPRIDAAFSQERLGVNVLASFAASSGLVWRENHVKDVGIDGQLEYVDELGFATGRIVAVQIKSGLSFFCHDDGESWRFYPEQKHRLYWERFPIPVILILNKPDTREAFWVDVRQLYRSGKQDEAAGVAVPKLQELSLTSRARLFENSGVIGQEFTEDLDEVLKLMVKSRSGEASFPLTFFQLFVNGLTNIVRSLHFGMGLVTDLVEMNLSENGSEFGMGLGFNEYEFLFQYIQFLVSQDLAGIDFGDCLIDWNDRQMVPRFVAPLSSRGRALVRLISDKEDQLRSMGALPNDGRIRVAQEHLIQWVVTPSDLERIPLIRAFEHSVLRAAEK